MKCNPNRYLRDRPYVKNLLAIRMLNVLREEFRGDSAEGAYKLRS